MTLLLSFNLSEFVIPDNFQNQCLLRIILIEKKRKIEKQKKN